MQGGVSPKFSEFWDLLTPSVTCNSTLLLKRLIVTGRGISFSRSWRSWRKSPAASGVASHRGAQYQRPDRRHRRAEPAAAIQGDAGIRPRRRPTHQAPRAIAARCLNSGPRRQPPCSVHNPISLYPRSHETELHCRPVAGWRGQRRQHQSFRHARHDRSLCPGRRRHGQPRSPPHRSQAAWGFCSPQARADALDRIGAEILARAAKSYRPAAVAGRRQDAARRHRRSHARRQHLQVLRRRRPCASAATSWPRSGRA